MKRQIAVGGLVLLLAILAVPARAGMDEAKAARERGDNATAIKELTPLATNGSAEAQNELGTMYKKGEGVAQDSQEAIKWYRLAADQGNAEAQINLGSMYDHGEGVAQDYHEAVKWFRLAADQGDPNGQLKLGFMYEKGRGVTTNRVVAYALYNLAATNDPCLATANRSKLSRSMSA
jgi:TPR repeat protein